MKVSHRTVFSEEGIYAGWPANHGGWQWGDEFLVGFIRGRHNVGGMHNVIGHLEKVQARSLDGGETWSVEKPNADFECSLSPSAPPQFEMGDGIIRVCGIYDHGGDDCIDDGGFYLSRDKGHHWSGPYLFKGIYRNPEHIATSRTCVVGSKIFLSYRHKRIWGSDYIYCAEHNGTDFSLCSTVLADDCRAVMPSAAVVGERVVVAIRRTGRGRGTCWIDSVYSSDGGATWSDPVEVLDTGGDNGNPPAIISCNGKLYCVAANRNECAIVLAVSHDSGESWQERGEIRSGGTNDIGYPRLFKRSDGRLACVYYWSNAFDEPQSIESTIFDAE